MNTLLQIGLTNALLATALAVIAAAAAWLFRRRPALVHSLWLLVLLKLVTPPLVSFSVPWPDTEVPTPSATQPQVIPVTPPELGKAAPTRTAQPIVKNTDPGHAATPASIEPAAPTAMPPDSKGEARPSPAVIVGVIWLLGVLLWWLIAAVRICRFHRSLRHARAAPPALQAEVRRLAGRLGLSGVPEVLLLPAPVAPLVWALGRSPRVLLPAALWRRLSDEERQTLLVHELAHLRRRDHWVRRLELLVLGLYWWHPVAWWARRQIQEAEEQCCDAWVVWALPESSDAYAQALVHTVRYVSGVALPVAASGIRQVPHLKRRLQMILQGTMPRRLSRFGLGAVVALGLVILPLVPAPAQSQPPAAGGKDSKNAQNAVRAAQIDKARAEVKLLQAQLEAKRVEMRAMEARLQKALEQLAKLEGRKQSNFIVTFQWEPQKVQAINSKDVSFVVRPEVQQIIEARVGPNKIRPEVRKIIEGKRFDLKVHPELVQTIEARVSPNLALEFARARSPEQRLAELEKQVKAMLKEMAELRQEMQSQGPQKK